MDSDDEGGERFSSLCFCLFCSITFSRYLFSYARRFLGCPVMDMGF